MRRSNTWLAIITGTLAGCGVGNVSGDIEATHFGDLSNPPAERRDGHQEIAAACGDLAAPLAETPLRRQPYLQQLTDRSVQLMWTEADDTPAAVTVTDASGAAVARVDAIIDGSVVPRAGMRQWMAPVTGLRPSTIYCYRIGAAEGDWLQAGFRTAPAAGAGLPVRFVAFGDSGSADADQFADLDQMRTVPFDFMIHTGDIAYDDGTLPEFESQFFGVYAGILKGIPAFPASGNHEYNTDGARAFRDVFSLPPDGGTAGMERWYSFDWGDVHFVALDTERTGPTQAAWLDADLTANQLPWTIVYWHKPPFSSGEHGSDGPARQYFVPVVQKHHVPLVLNGHEHDYERSKPQDGVTYVVTGGGGKGTRSVGTSSFTAFSEAVIHFVYVEVAGDTLALHAIDGTGVEFDSLVLHR